MIPTVIGAALVIFAVILTLATAYDLHHERLGSLAVDAGFSILLVFIIGMVLLVTH